MKKYIKHFLLVSWALFSASQACWAVAPPQAAWKKNTTAALDLGFGIPVLYVLDDKDRGTYSANINWHAGLVLGYAFPLGKHVKLGPQTGILYGFTRSIEQGSGVKRDLQESHLQIPIACSLALTNAKDPTQLDMEYCLGYEWDIPLVTKYQLGGNEESKDADVLGNIFIKTVYHFPMGFYGWAKIKVNTLVFKDKSERHKEELQAMRFLATSFTELGVGANIIEWL